MTKRAASYDINPVTFEETERVAEDKAPLDPNAPHMRGRKIYKLVKNPASQQAAKESSINLKIIGLTGDQERSTRKPQQEKTTSNIFKASPPMFELSQGISLLSNPFASSFGEKKASESILPKLFENKGSQNTEKSLFANSKSLFDGKYDSGSLFGGQNSSTSFFGNGSLFGGQKIETKPGFGSLFNPNPTSQQPQPEKQEDDGDSAELEKAQNMEVDPSKSTKNFDYKEQCRNLSTVKLAKFKKDKGELLNNLTASLLFDYKTKGYFIIVRLAATFTPIYSGLLIPHKSQVKILNNKSENIQILSFNINETTKKFESHVLKIQVNNAESKDDEEFFKIARQIIEGTFKVHDE